jgi:hypothetical protein
MAGIRLRHPSANEREICLRYAMQTLGVETAAMVYPDARPLAATAVDPGMSELVERAVNDRAQPSPAD